MYCSKCGKEIIAESKFCLECGSKVIISTIQDDTFAPENIVNITNESAIPNQTMQNMNILILKRKKLIKTLGILRLSDAGMWILLTILQIYLNMSGINVNPLLIGWNILGVAVCIKFGIDLLHGKNISRNTVLCVISLIFYGIQFVIETYIIIFFILFEIVILVISVIARSKPNKQNRNITITSIICGLYIIALVFSMNIYKTEYPKSDLPSSNLVINDKYVRFVKNGILHDYPNQTVGKAFDNFMWNAEWESFIATDGNRYVNVTGIIIYAEKEVEATIQFFVDIESDKFDCRSCVFNDIQQSNDMLLALLYKIYE